MTSRIDEIRAANKRALARFSEDYCPDCSFLLGLVDQAFGLLSGDEPYEPSSVTPWLAKYRSEGEGS